MAKEIAMRGAIFDKPKGGRPMSTSVAGWLFFRCLRWLLWIATAALYAEFYIHRDDHLNSFGHIVPTTELWMFALPLMAVFAGFFELMMRERAGLARPAILRNWTAQAPHA
jgi:hypothetical protein